jgi:hypothetical protein
MLARLRFWWFWCPLRYWRVACYDQESAAIYAESNERMRAATTMEEMIAAQDLFAAAITTLIARYPTTLEDFRTYEQTRKRMKRAQPQSRNPEGV